LSNEEEVPSEEVHVGEEEDDVFGDKDDEDAVDDEADGQ
jgi:hypothetical protein